MAPKVHNTGQCHSPPRCVASTVRLVAMQAPSSHLQHAHSRGAAAVVGIGAQLPPHISIQPQERACKRCRCARPVCRVAAAAATGAAPPRFAGAAPLLHLLLAGGGVGSAAEAATGGVAAAHPAATSCCRAAHHASAAACRRSALPQRLCQRLRQALFQEAAHVVALGPVPVQRSQQRLGGAAVLRVGAARVLVVGEAEKEASRLAWRR